MEAHDSDDIVIVHPNRRGAEAKAMKAAVVFLLVVSAIITAIVTFGGWSKLEGAQIWAIFFIVIYLVMAYIVSKWNRGILPVAAGLAILLVRNARVLAEVEHRGRGDTRGGGATLRRGLRPTAPSRPGFLTVAFSL
jgi:hypothetical protein